MSEFIWNRQLPVVIRKVPPSKSDWVNVTVAPPVGFCSLYSVHVNEGPAAAAVVIAAAAARRLLLRLESGILYTMYIYLCETLLLNLLLNYNNC